MDSEGKVIVYIIGIVFSSLVILAFFGKGCTEIKEQKRTSITIHALEKGCSVIYEQVVCPCKQ